MTDHDHYLLKLARTGEVILEASDDADALQLMAASFTRTEVAALFHITGPPQARAQRRLWPTPPAH